jgi:hypothetical protein
MLPLSLPHAMTEPVKVSAPTATPDPDLDRCTSSRMPDAPAPGDGGVVRVAPRPGTTRRAHQHGGEAHEAVQHRHQLGHAGHLDRRASTAPMTRRCRWRPPGPPARRGMSSVVHPPGPRRRPDREHHAHHAERVAAPRRLLLGQAAQRADEEHARDEVRDGEDELIARGRPDRGRGRALGWNIFSMRCVTKKPPAMLMVATRTASAPSAEARSSSPPICSMPPTMMMPLMALVTLMSGVWSAGETAPDHLPAHEAGQHEHREVLQEVRRGEAAEQEQERRRPAPPSVLPHARATVGVMMSCCAGFASEAGGGAAPGFFGAGATAVGEGSWAARAGGPRPCAPRARADHVVVERA